MNLEPWKPRVTLRPGLRRIRRTVDRARGVEVPLLIGLGMLAFGLGLSGFEQIFPGNSLTDSIHQSVRLFVVDFSGNPHPPLQLDIARFLAPAVAGYAAIRAFIAIFRSQIATALLRRWSGHVVVAGLGDTGFTLARTLRDNGVRVAVIERAAEVDPIAGCRERGIPVITGDATDPEVLAKAGTGRAAWLVTTLGDDAANVDAAFSAAETIPRSRSTRLTVFAHLDDLSLWRLLSARGIATADANRITLEFFNLGEMAARVLTETCPPPPPRDRGPVRVGVVVDGTFGESVIVSICRQWRNDPARRGREIEIVVIDPTAAAVVDRMRGEYPEIDSIASLTEHDSDLLQTDAIRWARDLRKRHQLDLIYVCMADERRGLAASLALDAATGSAVPVVLSVRDQELGAATVLGNDLKGTLEPFGVLTRTLTAEFLQRGVTEALAKATHDHYEAARIRHGDSAEENLALKPWSELADDFKQSNRDSAAGIGAKLERVGATLAPSPFADPDHPGFEFAEPEPLEALAEMEHERWARDSKARGWTYGPVRDNERKIHPNLVAWDELSQADQEKDRDAVRAIPSILARAGFEITPLA